MKYFTLLVFLFITVSTKCQNNKQSVDSLYKEGMELLKGNFKEEAKEVFAKALKIELRPEVVDEYAKILISQKNIDAAAELIDKCRYKFPKEPVFAMLMGNIYSIDGYYKDAIYEFNVGIKLKPKKDLEKYYLYRAVAQERDKNYDEAFNDYRKSLEINPNQPEVYFYYGALSYKQNKFEEATTNLNKAIQYGYTNKYVYLARGMAYLGAKETIKACLDFRKSCNDGNIEACKLVVLHCTKK